MLKIPIIYEYPQFDHLEVYELVILLERVTFQRHGQQSSAVQGHR